MLQARLQARLSGLRPCQQQSSQSFAQTTCPSCEGALIHVAVKSQLFCMALEPHQNCALLQAEPAGSKDGSKDAQAELQEYKVALEERIASHAEAGSSGYEPICV